jgi:L-fucose isomerase-like protein
MAMQKIKIGFVAAHREPFDEEWAVEMRQRCLEAFPAIKDIEIVVPDETLTAGGLVRNDQDAERTINLFKQKEIDALIIGTMTFGDEVSALTLATAFRHLPILLFGTKEDAFSADGGRKSDSFCGTLSISSGLFRRHIPFLFGGVIFPEEAVFVEKVRNFVRVSAIVRGFVGARVGLVGPRPERFETCISSEDAMMRKFGQRVVPTSLPDIMSRAAKIEKTDIQTTIEGMRQEADLSALQPETINQIAGLELALQQFGQEKGLAGMGIQCWTAMQEVYGFSACYAMGRLTDKGYMTACEVDIYGVLTMLLQYLAGLQTSVPHFIDWTIKHQEEENVFLAWHCGNGPPSLACRSAKIKVRAHSILGASLGIDRSLGTGEFQIKSGPVTLCRLIERDGDFKLLICKGTIVEADQELRGSWSWVKVANLEALYQCLVKEGFSHHASLMHGDYGTVIKDACQLLGIQTVEI